MRHIAVIFSLFFTLGSAFAMPFSTDMFDVQKRTGTMMRPKEPNTVPVGVFDYYVKDRAAAEALINPQDPDHWSVSNGSRLYRVNCYACHGDIEVKPWKAGPVGEKLKVVPNIQGTDPTRNKDYTAVSDGWIYSVIHYGSVSTVMPAYGWKLSPNEHWDIINYVRSTQRKIADLK